MLETELEIDEELTEDATKEETEEETELLLEEEELLEEVLCAKTPPIMATDARDAAPIVESRLNVIAKIGEGNKVHEYDPFEAFFFPLELDEIQK